MFETLVSRLTSPTASRRRHSYHQSSIGTREVQSDPETDDAPVGARGARPLLERRRRARRAPTGAPTTDSPRGMAALRAFLPLRPSKSLGRLDGIKEIERLAQYERLAGSGGEAGARRRGQRLSDLERVQDLFPNDFLALHEHDVVTATAGTLKSKTLLRKRPSLDVALGASQNAGAVSGNANPCHPRQFVMEAPCSMTPAPAAPHQSLNAGAPPAPPSTPTQDRHLFLFTDLLLIAKSRGNNSFKLKEAVRLSEVWASAGNSDTSFLLGWAGAGSPTTYILTYPTQAARDSWLRKIQSALNTQIGFEPKTTNMQILYKDNANSIEFSKTLSVTPEMTTSMVIKQALQLVQGGVNSEGNASWGPARDFCLWARTSRDSAPVPLIGCERPHAIQMSRIRQTLSNEEGFDLEHVNSKNNPCGMVFELRKISRNVIKTRTPLKLFRRSSGRLFGVSLARLCPNGGLPAAVLTMLRVVHRRGPHTQGIFRKSANAKALKHLREKVDNAGAAGARCPELDSAPVLLVASLLKDFLRSLPQPLMCDSFYPGWISVLSLTPSEKISSMRSLLLKLPKVNYNLLSHFVAILQAIARNSAINLMCPMNLAVCVGPSLLWPNVPCETAPKAVPALIELLIINAEILFGPHLHSIFGKGSPEPSALSLDSGAEESDSLHSVGLSLDSLDLTCTRKEKLSLSRDSGLTLSEDDSNSNGGNSPAPRNGQTTQILPQAGIQTHQAQRVYAKCYTTDPHGLPKSAVGNYDVVRKNNIYVKKPENDGYMKYENIYGTAADVQKTIESQQKIYDSIAAQNRYNTNYHDSQAIYGTSMPNHNLHNGRLIPNGIHNNVKTNSSPSKYLTGYEPEKPPRLGINRNNRNAKVHSIHIENTNEHHQIHPNKIFCRAKSSDDLLDKRNERNIYNTRGSQENIYGNVTVKSKAQKSNLLDSKLDLPLQSYSRVYGGWEQRMSNYTNPNHQNISYSDGKFKPTKQCINESIYDVAPVKPKSTQNMHMKTDCDQVPTSTIFTRKDWSRQASRTKSLDVASADCPYPPGTYQEEEDDENAIYKQVNDRMINCNPNSYKYQCNLRSIDPSHACSKNCMSMNQLDTEKMDQNQIHSTRTNSNINKSGFQKSIPASELKKSLVNKISSRKPGHSSKYDKNTCGGKLVHSKSLANIVLHSNSSSNDTLYQPSGYLKQGSPASSENFSNKFSSEYPEDIYGVARRKNGLDMFCENMYGKMGSREPIYSSDIYTAKPTSVGSSYSSENKDASEDSEKRDYVKAVGLRNPSLAPPVPPRKSYHNSPLKNLPPVHLVGEDRKSRSKSVTSVYQEQQDSKKHNQPEENKTIASGTRAPVTSYHLGNSCEKFILALEDSGTDTESESYV
ncbi:uncharacterized protein LOC143910862 isoform X2 [Arctopsyche grandis]|uniref:uncharacterized protein LOC143910862 isoform X2 n=1 Tax=Arctopsyche grandis TaxID=121162 RepID=UPI00406D7173